MSGEKQIKNAQKIQPVLTVADLAYMPNKVVIPPVQADVACLKSHNLSEKYLLLTSYTVAEHAQNQDRKSLEFLHYCLNQVIS